MTQISELSDLLASLFSSDELRRFTSRHLSSLSSQVNWSAPLSQVTFELAGAADRRGLIGESLWTALAAERGGRKGDIQRVQALFASPSSQPPPSSPPAPVIKTWTQWVADPEGIDEIANAQLAAGQGKDAEFEALLDALDATFGNTLDTRGAPTTRLRKTLRRLNKTRNLVSGEIPLQRWLREARALAGGQSAAIEVFTKYLKVFPGAEVEAPQELPPVTEAEADGITLEAQLGEKDQTVSVAFLRAGWNASRSVARLLVPRFGNGTKLMNGDVPEYAKGTGWLLTPDLLITNYHVIEARDPDEDAASNADFEAQALNTEVEFDLIEKGAKTVRRKVGELVLGDPSPERDFVVLRLMPAPADGQRKPLRLATSVLTRPRGFKLSQRVNVLQHPDGDPMRLGFRDNFVLSGDAKSLSYLTDTDGGSSGSPVLDDKWQVVALHRGSRSLAKSVVVRNHEIATENFGPTVSAILERLKERRPEIHEEVVEAQGRLCRVADARSDGVARDQ